MARLILPVLLLLLAGVTGLRNGPGEFREAATDLQRVAAATEIAYGVASWAALAALLTRRSYTRGLLIVWAALLTVTGFLAAMAWGGAGVAAAAVGGICIAALCGLAIWLADTWLARQRVSRGGGK